MRRNLGLRSPRSGSRHTPQSLLALSRSRAAAAKKRVANLDKLLLKLNKLPKSSLGRNVHFPQDQPEAAPASQPLSASPQANVSEPYSPEVDNPMPEQDQIDEQP